MDYTRNHPRVIKYETRREQIISDNSRTNGGTGEIPPEITVINGPVTSRIPYESAVGALALLTCASAVVALRYRAQRRNWHCLAASLSTAGLAYLTYTVWLNYEPGATETEYEYEYEGNI